MGASTKTNTPISNLHQENSRIGLSRNDLTLSPLNQFEQWLEQAVAAQLIEPHAMILATVTKDGRPSARTVILRGFDEQGFVFYTNYESPKSRELSENPNATLVSYWAELGRQIRVTGQVSRASSEESDHYFQNRSRGSQLGALASKQSQVINSRAVLENKLKKLEAEYQGRDIPRPPFWGGFRLVPNTIEFWQSRPNRLHDRFLYTRQPDDTWRIERLSP